MATMDLGSLGLARHGDDIRIYDRARLIAPERIELGSHIVIDDFALLQGGQGIVLGDHVHVASFASITGGGTADIGSFCGIASGARVLTGSDLFDGSGLTGPTIPPEARAVERSFVRMGAHVVVGANSVVHPGVTLGEGAILGSGAVALADVEPWTINVGMPCRPVRERPRERILELARGLAGS